MTGKGPFLLREGWPFALPAHKKMTVFEQETNSFLGFGNTWAFIMSICSKIRQLSEIKELSWMAAVLFNGVDGKQDDLRTAAGHGRENWLFPELRTGKEQPPRPGCSIFPREEVGLVRGVRKSLTTMN